MTLAKHMPALDGLRGIAILLVMYTHVSGGWSAALSILRDSSAAAPLDLPTWLRMFGYAGAHGVQLFFVVSAFTLTTRFLREKEARLGAYALRRIARVAPAYWIAAVGYTLLAGSAPRLSAPDGLQPVDFAIALFFGSAWQGGPALAVVPGGWSVACEMSFYVVLPFVLRLVDGRVWRAVVLTTGAMFLAQLCSRHFAFVNPLVQAPAFLCGITAALIAAKATVSPRPRTALALLLLAVFALPYQPVHHWYLLQQIPFSIMMAGVALLAASNPPDVLVSRSLRRIGEVSYSMYLIHFAILPVSLWLATALVPSAGVETLLLHAAITFTATFPLACVSHAWIERPAIRWAASRTRTLERPEVGAAA